jgi:cysteine desulfurase
VLATAAWLEQRGVNVTRVAPRRVGRGRRGRRRACAASDTALVSVMLANNETGVLQPIEAISAATRAHGVPLHVDAVAALGKVPVDVGRLGCDLLSLAGHKLYAPKGCGVLWIRAGVAVDPLVHGCGQQRGMRGRHGERAGAGRLRGARSSCSSAASWATRTASSPGATRWSRGSSSSCPAARRNGEGPSLPNNGQRLVPGTCVARAAGRAGPARAIAVSFRRGGPAGASPSHVLLSMGCSPERARESLRFSFRPWPTARAPSSARSRRWPTS